MTEQVYILQILKSVKVLKINELHKKEKRICSFLIFLITKITTFEYISKICINLLKELKTSISNFLSLEVQYLKTKKKKKSNSVFKFYQNILFLI